MKKINLLVLVGLMVLSMNLQAQYSEAAFQSRKKTVYDIIYNKYYCTGSGAGFQPCYSRPPGYFAIGTGDPFQYMGPKLIVVYERDGITGIANADTANSRLISHLEPDFDLFHFNYPGVAKLLYAYPNAPGIVATKKKFIQKMFNRTDSYNAFTGEGTENHILMSRLPTYLLCQLAVDSFPADFPLALAKKDSLKRFIMETSKRMYTSGVAEFNSATYEAYSVSAWLVLYDYAKDLDVKKAAKAALDYYSMEIALHYSQGIQAGGDMRGKGTTSSLDLKSSLAWLAWVWFGDSPRDVYNVSASFNAAPMSQCIYAAASTYRPSGVAEKLAKKKLTLPAMYYNSKGSYLLDNPNYIKQTVYLDSSYALGATYFPYGGWAGGDWQMVSWKLISRVDSSANKNVQFVSGQGMTYYLGGNYRTPFDQFAQHKNVMIQLTKVPSNAAAIETSISAIFNTWATNWDVNFVRRFSASDAKYGVNGGLNASSGRKTPVSFQNPSVTTGSSYMDIIANSGTINTATVGNIYFVELDKTYLAIRSINNAIPTVALPKLTDFAVVGTMSGYVLEVRNKSAFTSFANFQTFISANTSIDKSKVASENRVIYTSSLGDVINVQYQTSGTFTEPIYDWGYGPTSGKVLQKEPPFTQPTWPSGAGHGKIASWTVNGSLVDLSQTWGVYDGPNARIKNNILSFNDGHGDSLRVDYTGSVPVFTPNIITDIPYVLPESELKESILKIYPNPANDAIDISGSAVELNVPIEICNLSGQVLIKDIYTGRPIGIKSLPTGYYILVVRGSKGAISSKLLVE